MLTIEDFNLIKEWEIFMRWVIENSPHQIYMSNDNVWRLMKRVAVKWYANDRTFYLLWDDENSYEDVKDSWDKSSSRDEIQRIVNVHDDVMKLYRS